MPGDLEADCISMCMPPGPGRYREFMASLPHPSGFGSWLINILKGYFSVPAQQGPFSHISGTGLWHSSSRSRAGRSVVLLFPGPRCSCHQETPSHVRAASASDVQVGHFFFGVPHMHNLHIVVARVENTSELEAAEHTGIILNSAAISLTGHL